MDKWPAKQIVIREHRNTVKFIAFSPDGRQVVLCSDERPSWRDTDNWKKAVRIYDVETARITAGPFKFRYGHDILCAAYSTDGKNILCASTDGTIRAWNTELGVVDEPVEHITIQIDGEVDCAAFSHNREYIALARCHSDWGNDDHTSYISVCDVVKGSIVSGPFVAHKRRITCIAFSPDDKSVASGSYDGTICVWGTQTGELVAGPFEGHQDQVKCISYSHNGTFIASGSVDHTIRLWEVGRTPPQMRVYKGHTSSVNSVAFSSDDRRIVSGSGDYSVRVWDVETGDVVVRRLEGYQCAAGRVCIFAISPDGKRIASNFNRTFCILDVEACWGRRKFLDGHDDIACLALSKDRRHVVSGSEYGTILYWDMGTGELLGSLCEGNGVAVEFVACSPDGKRVVSSFDDGAVRIYEVPSGRVEKELRGYRGWVFSVVFSNNGRYIALTSNTPHETYQIRDTETGDCIQTFGGQEEAFR